MSVRSLVLLLAFVCGFPALFAAGDPCLEPGEQLHYSVGWAIVPGAGEINVSAQADGPNRMKITTETATRGLARWLLKFDATAVSTYDLATGRLLSLRDRSTTRGKFSEHIINFDYPKREAIYAHIGATKSRILPMPPGSPTDLITALLQTRKWNLKPGQSRDALVIFDDEFYQLTIHAIRYENVSTGLGRFRALLLEPRMEKTAPKGMFKKGSTVRVWIAQDARHLPVKFQVEFNIGTGTATLDRYVPPSAAASAGAAGPATAGSPAR